MSLVVCTACQRHVRADEACCPFCHACVDAGELAAPSTPPGRHGRVARMAFGAGLLFTVTACPAYGGPDPDFDGGPLPDAGSDAQVLMDAGHDAGEAMEDAGEAMEDAGEAMEDAGEPTEDAGEPEADGG
ncbi:MAG: hypothetical protein KF729_00300 [Sandaracinaceae bacterium]|nr:hypothetical protein [Sandaracinaceae bacterium]